jgi:DNA-binding response OmpR family regulator
VTENLLPSSRAASEASLLVVDAQANSRNFVVENLKRKGYAVDEATYGAEALAKVTGKPYDLVVLDVALPKSDGVGVMRDLRTQHPDLPIVVLTTRATVESAIAAVKLNVVDYMLKPCKIEDLALTISRALDERAQQARHQRLLALVGEAMNVLRQPAESIEQVPLSTSPHQATSSTEMLHVGALALDRQKRQAILNANPPRIVELTEGEFSILVALMEKPNQVLSYNELAKLALGYEAMDKWTVESVIRSTIFRLRHKIESGPDTPCLIRTVRGRGYFFSPA